MLQPSHRRRRFIDLRRARWPAALVALMVLSGSAWAQGRCMVTDPTGTPLNIRDKPNGAIVGALHNGTTVRQEETVLDHRGRPWSLVVPQGPGEVGWVFREFVSCY